ncbi:EF-hand domain-containing family member C2 [Pleuronectes platessa]|uniref:EF-hand domain-containing family member C2 n=1 Tax=Pleuronectes platessa TaxID=8262 RepID=UPI00232A5360|nr:EF-hand domain-containing family member C2 [Pleuronectes platessa]
MSLPFLPGTSNNKQLGKERFHKSQHFDYSNGLPMMVGCEKPGIGGELLMGQKFKPNWSALPSRKTTGLASWVAYDKQVLSFAAYFEEAVQGDEGVMNKVRECKIFFYLEDDTMQVVESNLKYTSFPQGTFIHRQRVPLPPPDHDQFYRAFHFNINQQMVLFSRTFTVTSCDLFTRNFLTKLGVILNEPTTVPDDPYSKLREQVETMNPLRPLERHDTLKQFLDHDGQVLRFRCFWDDSASLFGDTQDFTLHYFLSDDTIEILGVPVPNSGRDNTPKFLHRCKLLKHGPAHMKLPGHVTDRTMLNVIDSKIRGQRFMLDSTRAGAYREEFYKDIDLTVGGEVNVFGRSFLLIDCDDFTKCYYRSKYGIEDVPPIQPRAPPAITPPRLMPPYNGFGSEEDSLSFCRGLLPKPPQKDFQKFMEKDRLDEKVMTFHAKIVTTDPIVSERLFIVSYFLIDDTINVYEPIQRNSGIPGGRFLERVRVKKPGQQLFTSEPPQFFEAQDLYVGASVCINNVTFRLLDADEYTFSYMEQRPLEFPQANVGNVLRKLGSLPEEKLSEMRTSLTLRDPGDTGFISYESLSGLLVKLGCDLSEHEMLVLGRRFCVHEQPEEDGPLMLAVVQDLLMKKNFDAFSEMTSSLEYRDRQKTGRLSSTETRSVCKGSRLPLPENLLAGLLSMFAAGDEIDYLAFMSGINWVEQPAPPVMPDDTLKGLALCPDVPAEIRLNHFSGRLVLDALPGRLRQLPVGVNHRLPKLQSESPPETLIRTRCPLGQRDVPWDRGMSPGPAAATAEEADCGGSRRRGMERPDQSTLLPLLSLQPADLEPPLC